MLRAVRLHAVIYFLCLLAPWSLLWLDASLLFPYETGKAWVFRSIVELAFALFLAQYFTQPQRKAGALLKRTILLLLVAYLAWNLLALLAGIDPYRSFWSNFERMAGFLSMLHWAMYLICLVSVLNRKRNEVFLINLVLIIATVCALGLLDDQKRAISTLGNPIYLGNLAVLGLFMSGVLISSHKDRSRFKQILVGLFSVLVSVLMILALFSSASRGPVLALIMGVLAMLLTGWYRALRTRPTLAKLGALVFVVMIGLSFTHSGELVQLLKQSDHYAVQRLGRISLDNQTTADRLENWAIAYDASKDHLLLGWGQENYDIAFSEHYHPGVMDNAQIWFDRAHNAYLDVLVASGLPGLLLYIIILVFPAWLVYQHQGWSNWRKTFAIGFVVAYMAKNLVGFDTFSSTLVWLSMLSVILCAGESPPGQNEHVQKGPQFALTVGFVLIALLSSYFLNVKPYLLNIRIAGIITSSKVNDDKTIDNALEILRSVPDYAINTKLVVYQTMLDNVTANSKMQDGVFQQAGKMISQELIRQPRNHRIKYNASILLAKLGHYQLAIKLLEELTGSAPMRTIFWHRLGKVYSAAGEPNKAALANVQMNHLNPEWKP